MFWDKVSGIYDLFGKVYNGRVNRRMCRDVAKEIGTGDRVLECACGTGLITAAVAGKCRELVATDYSEGMLKQTRKKCGSNPNVTIRSANILELPFSDKEFDVVIAANVIHLLDDPCELPTAYAYAKRRGLRAAYADTGQTLARCPVSPGLLL